MAVVCDICTKKASAKRGLYMLTFVSGDLGDLCLMLEPIKTMGGLVGSYRPYYSVICTDCLSKLNITTALNDCNRSLDRIKKRLELPNEIKEL